MKTIISDKLPRILKNKKRLQKSLEIEITNRGKEVQISGTPENEFVAEKVIEAINFGFPISTAISIKEENLEFEIINIKNHTKRKDLGSIKARIIGKGGKALKTLSNLTNCGFEIKDNFVGIVGSPELLKNAQEATISIIKGTKHGNVYAHLEKNRPEPIYDLGLK